MDKEDKVVLMAFTEPQAAVLSGLSQGQLRYWDNQGFFKPSYGAENRRLKHSRIYSFQDVVGLRTLRMLTKEYGVPTRYLRKVRDTLQRPQEFWANTTLFLLGKRVYLEDPRDGSFTEPTSGQMTLKNIPLRRVIGEVAEQAREMRRRDESSIGRIDKNRHVLGNSEVIEGTRIPLSTIREYLEDGASVEEILLEFPSITQEDVFAARKRLGLDAA